MLLTELNRFWMVYRLHGSGSAHCHTTNGSGSTHRHTTKQSAILEAERLAANNPGDTFVVLKAVGALSTAMPKVRKVKITDPVEGDGVPF